jgi:hypothetical protein
MFKLLLTIGMFCKSFSVTQKFFPVFPPPPIVAPPSVVMLAPPWRSPLYEIELAFKRRVDGIVEAWFLELLFKARLFFCIREILYTPLVELAETSFLHLVPVVGVIEFYCYWLLYYWNSCTEVRASLTGIICCFVIVNGFPACIKVLDASESTFYGKPPISLMSSFC